MSGIKLQKRDHDFFISYGHGDLALVSPLVDLLKRRCGLRVWFDGSQGNAAARSSELLGGAIGNARGALFCLSESWKKSTCRTTTPAPSSSWPRRCATIRPRPTPSSP
jgi:hypothetical protein